VAENRRQFDTVLNLQAPAINTGNAARSLLASILGLNVPGSTYTAGGTAAPAQGPSGAFSSQIARRYNIPDRNTQPVSGATQGGVTFTSPASGAMDPAAIMARLEQFPGYQFAVDQARKNAGALGSATGSLGGNVLSALASQTAGQIAMPTFENYLNRLAGLTGGAQTASNTASNAAINTGVNVAQGLQNAGDSRASGIIGQAGSQIGSIGGILSGFGQMFGNQPQIPFNPGSVGGGGYRYGP
jgi:hypothetical protein